MNYRSLLFIVCLFFLILSFTHAEPRIALVIGNGEYERSPLRNPPNDARDVSKKLAELGFEVMTLIDAGQQQMYEAIRDFGRALVRDRNSVGLFYYAGHGMQVNGRNYLIPVDADIQAEDEVQFQSIDSNLVLSKMESANNKTNIILLDACRNNPFKRSFRSVNRGLAVVDAPKGSIIVYATSPGSVAADGEGRNGIFTEALLNNIEKSEEIESMLKDVRRDVVAKTGGEQTPWSSSSLTGNFYFNRKGEEVKPDITKEVVQTEPVKSTQELKKKYENLKSQVEETEYMKWLRENGYIQKESEGPLSVKITYLKKFLEGTAVRAEYSELISKISEYKEDYIRWLEEHDYFKKEQSASTVEKISYMKEFLTALDDLKNTVATLESKISIEDFKFWLKNNDNTFQQYQKVGLAEKRDLIDSFIKDGEPSFRRGVSLEFTAGGLLGEPMDPRSGDLYYNIFGGISYQYKYFIKDKNKGQHIAFGGDIGYLYDKKIRELERELEIENKMFIIAPKILVGNKVDSIALYAGIGGGISFRNVIENDTANRSKAFTTYESLGIYLKNYSFSVSMISVFSDYPNPEMLFAFQLGYSFYLGKQRKGYNRWGFKD